MTDKSESIWDAFARVIAEHEAKHGPLTFDEPPEVKIARLEAQLAESYAPCKKCGGPPWREKDFNTGEIVIFCDCSNPYEECLLPEYSRGKGASAALAAWNEANQKPPGR
jgi:hypothetical protein